MSDASRKALDDAIVGDRLAALGIARVRLLLDERLGVPHERVSPRPCRRRRLAVDDGEIDPLGLTAGKLRLQPLLRRRILGEHHETRRVLVDAVDDKRPALGVRSEALLNLSVDGGDVGVALERNRQDPRRLADDDQHPSSSYTMSSSPVGPVRGRRPRCPGDQPRHGRRRRAPAGAPHRRSPPLRVVDEDLAALERGHGLPSATRGVPGAARNLSRRTSASAPPTIHCWPVFFTLR